MELAAMGLVPSRSNSPEQAPTTILGLMGLVFLVVGGLMVFGRQWLVLDLGKRTVSRQLGLLAPMRTEERSLSEFKAVVIAHHPGDSDSAETYPVLLRAYRGKDIQIISAIQFAESLRAAEFLAQTLYLPLSDATTDRETTVAPERAGQSLRDRLAREAPPSPPPRPAVMHSQVEEGLGSIKISIPGGSAALLYLGAAIPFAVILVAMPLVSRFLTRNEVPPAIRIVLLTVLMLIFGLPAIFGAIRLMVASRRRETTITASSSRLIIVQPKGRKMNTTVISGGELFDIDYSTVDSAITTARSSVNTSRTGNPNADRTLATLKRLVPNPGIIVKSRESLLTIAEGLPTEELQYLVWLLRKAVSG